MPTINVQDTAFTLSVLPLKLLSKGFWVRTETLLKNDYVSYFDRGERFTREEMEEWLFAMFRLLAGAYGKEYSISFEKAGFAVDLYPYSKEGEETTREERRANDCVMAIRFLMRSADKKSFLGGVYTLLLHREELFTFATELRKEFDAAFAKRVKKRGKYLFVGVSPKWYHGCNYWYLDESQSVRAGEYVWACMGRHNRKQLLYVDSVRWCDDDTAPYDPNRVKRILEKENGKSCLRGR